MSVVDCSLRRTGSGSEVDCKIHEKLILGLR